MRTNAKDYLIEFANSQESWIKALIYKSIETNGDISNEDLDIIYNNLALGTELEITEPEDRTANTGSKIILKKLTHNNGVNALKKDQTIKFCDHVTVLYGLERNIIKYL